MAKVCCPIGMTGRKEDIMTREEATNMLKARLECLKRETSGINLECTGNCDECFLCYEQGNLREQQEALGMAIKALEQQICEDKRREE